MVVTYFRQQTLVPLQQLGRYIGFGILGSLLLGFGVVFLAMSGLRALQDETGDTFTGDWSWVPYLIMFVVLLFGAALVWLARTARRRREGVRMSAAKSTADEPARRRPAGHPRRHRGQARPRSGASPTTPPRSPKARPKTGLVRRRHRRRGDRVPARAAARPQEEHHRRGPADLMAGRSGRRDAADGRARAMRSSRVGAAASAARVIRKGFTARMIARVGSTALRKGMHSGSPAWFYVAAAATGASAAAQVHGAHGRDPHDQAQAGAVARDPRDPTHEVAR